jgi:hypothetical protein
VHKKELEEQMMDLQANLEEVKLHEKEAKNLLNKQNSAKINSKS